MKNVAKEIEKESRNVFTKKSVSNTIRKNCNPLKVYKRRDGLYMRKTKDISLDEVIEELNFIEKVFFKRKFIEVYKKGIKKGFNWSNTDVR